jgi:UrcA family protein
MIGKIAAAALAAAFLVAAPAQARESAPSAQPQVVRHGDLDLSTMADRAQLLSRLERASARACRDVEHRASRMACRADTLASAVALAPRDVRDAMDIAMTERARVQIASR